MSKVKPKAGVTLVETVEGEVVDPQGAALDGIDIRVQGLVADKVLEFSEKLSSSMTESQKAAFDNHAKIIDGLNKLGEQAETDEERTESRESLRIEAERAERMNKQNNKSGLTLQKKAMWAAIVLVGGVVVVATKGKALKHVKDLARLV